MRDQYDREINYMRLSVTDRCNLRCRYCIPEEGVCKKTHEEMLTEDEMIAAAVEAGASPGHYQAAHHGRRAAGQAQYHHALRACGQGGWYPRGGYHHQRRSIA